MPTKGGSMLESEDSVGTATLYFDGACRGNPGTAGIGFVLRDVNGRVIERFSRLLCYNLTNKVAAEYKALIAGLQHALDNGFRDIVAYGDSELVCDQVNGKYRVRNVRLRRYCNTVSELQCRFKTCRVLYVPREQNQDADGLAKRGILDDPVDDCTDEILRRCTTPRGATKYVLEKRCEGFSLNCALFSISSETIFQTPTALFRTAVKK